MEPAPSSVALLVPVDEVDRPAAAGQSPDLPSRVLPVVGVDEVDERTRPQLVLAPSERLRPRGVHLLEVSVETRRADQVARDLEVPAAPAERRLPVRSTRHVLERAPHSRRPSVGIGDHLAAAVNEADAAVRTENPVLDGKRLAVGTRRVDHRPGSIPVVRVVPLANRCKAQVPAPGRQAVDSPQLVRPVEPSARDVPLPAADPRDRLRLGQPTALVLQRADEALDPDTKQANEQRGDHDRRHADQPVDRRTRSGADAREHDRVCQSGERELRGALVAGEEVRRVDPDPEVDERERTAPVVAPEDRSPDQQAAESHGRRGQCNRKAVGAEPEHDPRGERDREHDEQPRTVGPARLREQRTDQLEDRPSDEQRTHRAKLEAVRLGPAGVRR